ncbi:ATP-dependent DNA helicase PIF1-like [Eriocheir sinensis]|uniref:ATP-dependent DNA helicase PIF1-like n=1 Tax=Eriocheir sinensis TaxID=95602 RepID=UPI0021C75F1E|nr:ATP-dependent DNA helicase PIF1-like [Eriocheir sinensis]XP_050713557.1 ATP-dependent DNA helicase PIF1-like [Eriocheir sinensis]
METPEKGPEVPVPLLECTLTVEVMRNNAKHTSTHKKVKLMLGRNEFRDLILRMQGAKSSLQWPLSQSFQLHTRFMKEGKATISLGMGTTKLMVSNAPPNALLVFLKVLASKKAVGVEGQAGPAKGVTARQRLLSTRPSAFEEISPLTLKEYEGARQKNGRPPLKEQNGQQQQQDLGASPVTSKRRSEASPGRKAKVSRFLTPSPLTQEQKRVIQAVHSGHNVFFTGSAGTGKSFLLQRLLGSLPPDTTFVTASTGIAASHIGGATLHSFAGIGKGDDSLAQCVRLASRKTVAQQWRKCKHLIVDEVSMVDGLFFEKLEAVAQAIRNNTKPFGGIQLILCGDFLQLPPVTRPGQERIFCFQTEAWQRCITQTLELTQVKRQDDQSFIRILQSVRLGRCSEEAAEVLQGTKDNTVERNGIKASRLCTHRSDADHINAQNLAQLTGPERVFESVDSDPSRAAMLDSSTPVGQRLVLKVGCQVMLAKNLEVGRGLVNGARGVVTAFTNGRDGNPIVRFMSGVTSEVRFAQWRVAVVAGSFVTRMQLPLKLAWAFSIHKSQGMTLDCAEMSFSRVFEAGQVYVALSRARNLQGLRVLDFNPSCVRAHPSVLKFYHNLRREQSLS